MLKGAVFSAVANNITKHSFIDGLVGYLLGAMDCRWPVTLLNIRQQLYLITVTFINEEVGKGCK